MKNCWKKGTTVLFQGDSITDWGRNWEDDNSYGHGYVGKVVELYNTLYPDSGVKFYNKGIGGNRTIDLVWRYEKDFRDLNPDFISILIGVNDTWRRYDSGVPMPIEEFEKNYRTVLDNIKRDLPNTKIMIMEPFLIHTDPEKIAWHEDLDEKIQVVRKLAKEYADYFLPLDGILTKCVVDGYTCKELSEDGVHPSNAGAQIIALEYMKCLGLI